MPLLLRSSIDPLYNNTYVSSRATVLELDSRPRHGRMVVGVHEFRSESLLSRETDTTRVLVLPEHEHVYIIELLVSIFILFFKISRNELLRAFTRS